MEAESLLDLRVEDDDDDEDEDLPVEMDEWQEEKLLDRLGGAGVLCLGGGLRDDDAESLAAFGDNFPWMPMTVFFLDLLSGFWAPELPRAFRSFSPSLEGPSLSDPAISLREGVGSREPWVDKLFGATGSLSSA